MIFRHVKQFLLILFMAASLSALAQQPSTCGNVKEGKFEIHDKKEGTSVITRKGGVQHEENEMMGVVVEYLTEWLDECTFRLVPYKVLRNDNDLDLENDLKLEIEIVEVYDKMYVQVTTSMVTGQTETELVKIIR